MANFTLGSELHVYDASTSKPLGYGTECTLSVSADTIDCTSKFSGVWQEALPGQLGWTVSCSALYADASFGYQQLYSKMVARTPVAIKFAKETDTTQHTMGTAICSGSAYITSLELQAGNAEVASYSVEFTGNGALATA